METHSSPYDQFILFGDSLFEFSMGSFTASLQQEYARRLDIVNRGFAGYNTRQALKVLPAIMPDPKSSRVRFMAVLLGANDACFSSAQNGQHVPLDEYRQNIAKILTHPAVRAHSPRLILVTPPPVEERRQEARVLSQGYSHLNRTNLCTAEYVRTAREVAQELDVVCLDFWLELMTRAGWQVGMPFPGSLDQPENDVLRGFIHDGLHLTPEAYRVLAEKLMALIGEKWPDQMPACLPYALPEWDDQGEWEKEGLQMGRRG